MLKIMRKGAIENPWLFKIIMGVIAITFVGTMGWMGLSAPTDDSIAEVNGDKISLNEFRQSEKNVRDFYRNRFKEHYSEDLMRQLNIKKQVLDDLIEKRLWLAYAEEVGIEVSDEELRDTIRAFPAFQKKGRFDREIYDRILAANRISRNTFESERREALLLQKAKALVQDSVTVTDLEIHSEVDTTDPATGTPAQERPALVQTKQNRAIFAFTESLRTKAEINIKQNFLENEINPRPLPMTPAPAPPSLAPEDMPNETDQTQGQKETEETEKTENQ